MNVYGHTATSVVHALQWLPQHQGRIETQTVKNKTSNYWQSWVSHTCWSSPKEKEMTCLGVYDYECVIWKVFLFLGMLSPCGIIVPRPGIEPHPLHWGQRVLTTGPPGKSRESFFFFFFKGFVLCRMLFPFMSPFIHSSIQWSR